MVFVPPAAGYVSNDDRRRRACNARHVVVFGQPEASIPPFFRVLREFHGVAKGVCRSRARGNGRQIEN